MSQRYGYWHCAPWAYFLRAERGCRILQHDAHLTFLYRFAAGHSDLLYLLRVPETLGDAAKTVQDLARLDRPPPTLLAVQLLDPTEHSEIARATSGALRGFNREPRL